MSLQKGFFRVQSSNPNLPPEVWTLVYSKTTAGSFSYSASWGKYKIELSGGGGSGGATARAHVGYSHSETAGSNGELITKYSNVGTSGTVTFSGTVGSGASGSFAQSRKSNQSFTPSPSAGAAGTGYANGATGTTGYIKAIPTTYDSWSCASGSGGGSSSVLAGSTLLGVAKGGNGGNAVARSISQKYGGVGGSGGVSSGSGASGGTAAAGYDDSNVTSGAGSDGYVKIYKSNLKPEPV